MEKPKVALSVFTILVAVKLLRHWGSIFLQMFLRVIPQAQKQRHKSIKMQFV